MKTCSLCKVSKELGEFNRNKLGKSGVGGWCRQCVKAKNKSPEYRAKSNHWKQRNPKKIMLAGARMGAKRRGLEFSITVEDFDIPDVCPVFGIPLLNKFDGPRKDGTPALDRIDNTLGYVKGNVLVISWRANRIKSDATLSELHALVNFYETLLGNQAK